MPEMTKGNAREILTRTLDRFKSVTNESVGILYTWNGGLTVLRCESFRHYISDRKDDVWQSLAYTKTTNYCLSKAAVDRDMKSLLEEDIKKLNVVSLRRLISWTVQNHAGKSRNFWGKSKLKPSWWPEDIPFRNVSRNYSKKTLLIIVSSYKKFIHNESSIQPPTSATYRNWSSHATIKQKQPLKKDMTSKLGENTIPALHFQFPNLTMKIYTTLGMLSWTNLMIQYSQDSKLCNPNRLTSHNLTTLLTTSL